MFSLSERNEANACEHLRALLIGVTTWPMGELFSEAGSQGQLGPDCIDDLSVRGAHSRFVSCTYQSVRTSFEFFGDCKGGGQMQMNHEIHSRSHYSVGRGIVPPMPEMFFFFFSVRRLNSISSVIPLMSTLSVITWGVSGSPFLARLVLSSPHL